MEAITKSDSFFDQELLSGSKPTSPTGLWCIPPKTSTSFHVASSFLVLCSTIIFEHIVEHSCEQIVVNHIKSDT